MYACHTGTQNISYTFLNFRISIYQSFLKASAKNLKIFFLIKYKTNEFDEIAKTFCKLLKQ